VGSLSLFEQTFNSVGCRYLQWILLKTETRERRGVTVPVLTGPLHPFMSSRRNLEGSTPSERATCALPSPSTIMRRATPRIIAAIVQWHRAPAEYMAPRSDVLQGHLAHLGAQVRQHTLASASRLAGTFYLRSVRGSTLWHLKVFLFKAFCGGRVGESSTVEQRTLTPSICS
jgi:hypothetical protein